MKTISKALIGMEDLSQGSSTFNRATSTGGTITLHQVPMFVGAGSPNGVLTAPIGCLYLRTDGGAGTTLYVKESGSGSSGWVGK